MQEILTVSDIAAKLRVSRRRVQQLAALGRIPFVRFGSKIVVPSKAWEKWLAGMTDEALAAVRDKADAI